jgi:glycosyltransferase involved in cell wall biosynthesis
MKILLVIDSLGSGGAQRQIVNLAKGLKKNGHIVEIFIYDNSNNFFNDDIINSNIIIHYPRFEKKINKIKRSFMILRSLKLLLKDDFEHIISFLHIPSIYSSVLKTLFFRNIKLVVCERSSSDAPVNFWIKLLFYFACLVSNKVVSNSIKEKNNIKKRLGLSKKTTSIWNGYDIDTIMTKKKDSVCNNKTLTLIGRVSYPKNGVNLIKAMQLFQKRNNWTPILNWVGRRDNDNNSLDMQYSIDKILNNDVDISSNWNYLGEIKNIEEVLNKTDAIILPSIYEGLPNVVCESMFFGCCVIASDVSDIPMMLDNNRGILFNPNSPMSICLAIERFFTMDDSQKILMIKRAKKFAELNFNIDSMVKSYEKILIN